MSASICGWPRKCPAPVQASSITATERVSSVTSIPWARANDGAVHVIVDEILHVGDGEQAFEQARRSRPQAIPGKLALLSKIVDRVSGPLGDGPDGHRLGVEIAGADGFGSAVAVGVGTAHECCALPSVEELAHTGREELEGEADAPVARGVGAGAVQSPAVVERGLPRRQHHVDGAREIGAPDLLAAVEDVVYGQ